MTTSCRTFVLGSLRTGALDMAEGVAALRAELHEAESRIRRSIDLLVFWWSLGISSFVGALAGLLAASIWFGLGLVLLLVALSVPLSRLPQVRERMRSWKRYDPQHQQIAKSQEAIDDLFRKARQYQSHLEITKGPGLLACYSDILLHGLYPSAFPMGERLRFVELSLAGRGTEIEIFDYGRAVMELRACTLADFAGADNPLELVPAQNRYHAALSYAHIISRNTAKTDEEQVRLAGVVGLNAWLAFEAQGHPLTWDHFEVVQWGLVQKVLLQAVSRSVMGLAKAIAELNELERKQARQKENLL